MFVQFRLAIVEKENDIGRLAPEFFCDLRFDRVAGVTSIVGLAVVLLRSLVERRGELALLSALGFRPGARTRLVLDRAARLRVVPPVLGPPAGITIMDLPIRFPLPAKVRVRVMPPIELHEQVGADGDRAVEEGYRLVTSRMQRTLTRLANQRSVPVVG